jgi:putative ABC transport system ATP-binding protein
MKHSEGTITMQSSELPLPTPDLIALRHVSMAYARGDTRVRVLTDLTLGIRAGDFVALMGPSGSGKTTLLNVMAGLDRPTDGTVRVMGQDLGTLSEAQRAAFRAQHIGFIFQSYGLLPVLTAEENVALPLLLAPLTRQERARRATVALRVVGLVERARHRPGQLSGGQQQRVAIARAIVTDPSILVADEPTGDLDRESADQVLALMTRLQRELGKTIIMVTHDPLAAARASTVRHMDKGTLR